MRYLYLWLLLCSWVLQSHELFARDTGFRLLDQSGDTLDHSPSRPISVLTVKDSEDEHRDSVDSASSAPQDDNDDANSLRSAAFVAAAKNTIEADMIFKRELYTVLTGGDFPPRVIKRRRIGAWLGAAIGLVTMAPVCGVLQKTTRDLVPLPHSTALSDTATVLAAVSLSLPCMGLFAEMIKESITCSKCCYFAQDVAAAQAKLLFPVSRTHKVVEGFWGFATCVWGTTMLAQMAMLQLEAYSPSEVKEATPYIAVLTAPYLLFHAKLLYDNGTNPINNLFYKKIYPKNLSTKHTKKSLITKIRARKKEILRYSDSDLGEKYPILQQSNIQAGKYLSQDNIIQILESLKTVDEEQYTPGQDGRFFCAGIVSREGVANFLARTLIFAGSWARIGTLSYMTDKSLLWITKGLFGIEEPLDTFWISGSAATAAAIMLGFGEWYLHHTFMRKILGCEGANASPDNMTTKAGTVAIAGTGAALFTASNVWMGLKAFAGYPDFAQAFFIFSGAVLNFSSYYQSLYRYIHSVVSPIVTRVRSRTNKMRVVLADTFDQLKDVIMRLNDESTESLNKLAAEAIEVEA